jgi:hypothetical protein
MFFAPTGFVHVALEVNTWTSVDVAAGPVGPCGPSGPCLPTVDATNLPRNKVTFPAVVLFVTKRATSSFGCNSIIQFVTSFAKFVAKPVDALHSVLSIGVPLSANLIPRILLFPASISADP